MKTIKCSNIRVKVYARTIRRGAKEYSQFEIRWFDFDGRRQRMYAPTAKAAKSAATAKAEELQKGAPLAEMHPEDALAVRRFMVAVAPIGRALDLLGLDLQEAHRLAPGVPAGELARFYRANKGDAAATSKELGLAIEEFLKAKQVDKLISKRHHADLKNRLERFRVEFNRPLADITAAEVDTWRRGLAVENRTRNNFLGAVKNLFNWAERMGLVTAEQRAAVGRLEKSRTKVSVNLLWRPAEMEALLAAALARWQEKPGRDRNGRVLDGRWRTDEAVVPYLAIAAFAKLRTSEAAERLDWADIDLERGEIVVGRAKAKTGSARVIAMPLNLRAWLAPYAKKSGPVCPVGDVHRICRRVAERAGLAWRRNALRNSGITYHTVSSGDLARVTLEAGNSPAIARQEYLEIRKNTTEDAAKWFEIYPKTGPVVVQLKQVGA